MKFSIVTISFNQALYLEQAIRSVLEQDYDDVEYIVIDAGSKDGSREIIERYREQIDQIIFEPDTGPADGLNKGFEHASGDIFGFINSDDYLLPGALDSVAAAFSAAPEMDVLSGHAVVVDATGREVNRLYSRCFSLSKYVYGASVLAQQSTFFRAKPFREVGGFNVSNKVAWDGELWVDLALVGAKYGRIPAFLSAFRLYDDSLTGSGKLQKGLAQYQEDIFVKVKGRKRDWHDQFFKNLFKVREYLIHFDVVKQRLRSGPVVKNNT